LNYINYIYFSANNRILGQKIDVIAGLETRGYFFGIPLAMELGIPFVPIRKPGKLPGAVLRMDYGKEYGKF
jgi:adenine phosphoribosyltransferase